MSSIKQLAGQTVWYGASSIAARFINYLLTPYLTFKFTTSQYGEMSVIYAAIPFMNVLFTYGMETSFFRFANQKNLEKEVYSTSNISLITTTIFLSALLILFRYQVAGLLEINQHVEYITLAAFIIGIDALCALPFAKLRLDGRPVKFASARIAGILINIVFLYFFLSICPQLAKTGKYNFINQYFNPNWAVGYVLVANLIQSAFTFIILSKEFTNFKVEFNKNLFREMMIYSLPLIIAGFGGMINETFDRIMLQWWAPVSTPEAAKAQVGIYSACYKLSLLISLSVQAFRMGAEPFFFKESTNENAPKTYARVMKIFVITVCIMFLLVALYLDVWKYFIRNKEMYVGLKVVPVLLLANMCLGIYYNLSIWYKLANRTMAGAYITIIGAIITLLINYLFIPYFSYMASAWATFLCYFSMMVISFFWGQKIYFVPYAWKKLVTYILIVVILFFLHKFLTGFFNSTIFNLLLATLFTLSFIFFILKIERKEFQRLPIIGKFISSD
ncbi:MAG: oligosaccharide flippase family protein [Chitinophagaceae bacterium]